MLRLAVGPAVIGWVPHVLVGFEAGGPEDEVCTMLVGPVSVVAAAEPKIAAAAA